MFLKWLPWRFIASRLATAHGFLDPMDLLARMERLAQPSEVAAPMELVRAGMIFHARGFLNAKVIQQNLDWVWPFWVQRQFDPRDDSFVPRAFSITHVNLTHRNWTALGVPGCGALPIVDPRGLLTPLFDGWSLDAWLVPDDGQALLPPAATRCRQSDGLDGEVYRVETETTGQAGTLLARAWARRDNDEAPRCCARYLARDARPGWLVLAARPFNPEGLSFIHDVSLDRSADGWIVDGRARVRFSRPAERHVTSTYAHGDIHPRLADRRESASAHCRVGLATAGAMFRIDETGQREVDIEIDLSADQRWAACPDESGSASWPRALSPAASLSVPDETYARLYDASLRTLVLLSPDDIYPGPYTYKRFWFRDAVVIAHAMLCAGLTGRARRGVNRFFPRQGVTGFFHSQSGEWDSNGQVLWLLGRYGRLAGIEPPLRWRKPVEKAARWIARKRTSRKGGERHAGLLPAGFSAEHLGNNDFYYWDDYWSVAGLREAAWLCQRWGRCQPARRFAREAGDLLTCIDESLAHRPRGDRKGIPASPYRRMDAGAVGSLAGGYPLELLDADDPRLIATAEFLLDRCTVGGAFFQDMVHSGINAYLTLHIAQVLLRAGDERFASLADAVARLASPTGQWPEAIHPRTGGGCMGDGQHAWASAEWVMLLRNAFCRDEPDRLVLASGLRREWLAEGRRCRMGPLPTPHGPVEVRVEGLGDRGARVEWDADWRGEPPEVIVAPPGHERIVMAPGEGSAATCRPVEPQTGAAPEEVSS